MVIRSLAHDGQRELGFAVKRLIDLGGAMIGLVLLSPLLLVVGAWMRLGDGPPVLFRQTRIGLHGRPFTIIKFRTMAPDAEDRLDEVAHLNERSAVAFKATNDPRITRLGRTLRRSSIDELPQLWNVLVGQMSLAGSSRGRSRRCSEARDADGPSAGGHLVRLHPGSPTRDAGSGDDRPASTASTDVNPNNRCRWSRGSADAGNIE